MKWIHKYKAFFGMLLLTLSFNGYANQITRTILDIDQEILYQEFNLENKISRTVFKKSIEKHNQSKSKKHDILTIIDFGQPSNIKRLVVLDLKNNKVLFNEYVSHGAKSGGLLARSFSNIDGSHQSSLGQYLTENTYYGKHGYSLVLDGKEKTNSKAKSRYIVFHGAEYSSQSFLDKHGYLGRSHGCPSVDKKVSKKIINVIKEGSYIYAYK
jgi:hypothetical protein